MKSTQAWGWLMAGVLALGLNGFYQDGGAVWAHRALDGMLARFADRSGALADLASEQFYRVMNNLKTDGLMEKANLVVARDETASCRLSTAVARFQTRIARTQTGMAHFETMSARQEAQLARFEGNRARMEAQIARLRLTPVAFSTVNVPVVACPRVRVSVSRINVPRVNVPRIPQVRVPAPVVQVEIPGDGPI